MAPKLYMIIPPSPPVRSVLITARTLGVELEFEKVDLFNGQNKTPEYLKMNPQHTVPLLDDDGFYLADSHAICSYLVGKYAKDDSLYPEDLKKRGKVQERLHFDNGILFYRWAASVRPVFFEGATSVSQESIDKLNEAYEIMEKFLEHNSWIAGDQLTIADFCIFATASSANIVTPVDASKHPRLHEWLNKMETVPATLGIVREGLNTFKQAFKSRISH